MTNENLHWVVDLLTRLLSLILLLLLLCCSSEACLAGITNVLASDQ